MTTEPENAEPESSEPDEETGVEEAVLRLLRYKLNAKAGAVAMFGALQLQYSKAGLAPDGLGPALKRLESKGHVRRIGPNRVMLTKGGHDLV